MPEGIGGLLGAASVDPVGTYLGVGEYLDDTFVEGGKLLVSTRLADIPRDFVTAGDLYLNDREARQSVTEAFAGTGTTIGLGSAINALRGTRLPQDVKVDPEPPPARPTNRPIGQSPTQNTAAQSEVAKLRAEGYKDIRVNQQQVNAAGQRVGTNRPDIQATSPSGQLVYIEYDTSTSTRGSGHLTRLKANDPAGRIILRIIN